MSTIRCEICPHGCDLAPGKIGFCRARSNVDGEVRCINYGLVTSMALDPIEKKPLRHFYPNSMILSVGSFGCNLRCSFCQNHEISMTDRTKALCATVSPDELVRKAVELIPQGNIGIAFTYNEPIIGYEYVLDTARLAKQRDMKIVLVTNGYVCEEPLLKLLPYVDAMNIDLKSFSDAFYRRIDGDRTTVQRTIELSAKRCHVEVTTLIIPTENDSEEEMRELSTWLAEVDKTIPLHISRFFPRYKKRDLPPTPIETIERLADVSRKSLQNVYVGNL